MKQDTPMSPDAVDARILSITGAGWRKVAFVVATIGQENALDYDLVASRLVALVEAGKLESRGAGQWRHSEVRAPGAVNA